ncbi:MAG: hypothetical protein ACXWAT_00105 [Methylobacter sp.]
MPIARFEIPDGRIARFEVPEGTTPEQAHAMMSAHFSGQVQPKPATNAYSPADSMSEFDKGLAGVGMGMTNMARGAGQRLRDVLPNDLSNKLGLPTAADIEESRRLDKSLADSTAGKVGNFIGETALTAPLPGGTLAKALGTGATLGALTPTTENESALQNAALGAAGGGLGHGVISGAGRLLRPVRSELTPEVSALAKKAQDMGIELNAAQLTGSKPLNWINSVMNDLPLTAGAQHAYQDAQKKQFNAAIAKTMGTQADNLGESVMAETKQRIGGGIGDIAARNKFNLDNQAFTDLVKNKFDAQRFETSDVNNVVNNTVDDFFSKVEPDGKVSGEAYRKLDSKLGQRMRGTTNGDLRHALGEVRDSLRAGMDRSITPQDAADWSKLRSQYRNMKLVEPVAAKSTDGNINPALLLGAAIRGDKNAAYSSSELKDLGKIGKEFLKDMPNSGTAPRSFYTQMLTNPMNGGAVAAGLMAGGTPGAATAGLLSALMTSGLGAIPVQKAMNSKAGKKYLTEGILKGLQAGETPALRYLAAPAGAQGLINLAQ